MTVFVTGGNGFIGRRLVDALLARGWRVICAVRHGPDEHHPDVSFVASDFSRDHDPAMWRERLGEAAVVINAVGILREGGAQTFQSIHVEAPRALFDACVQAGVSRVIQLSALGADEGAASSYHLSKRKADDYLTSLPISAAIVQPSLVFGAEGASARLFTTWASLPLVPLPGRGEQRVQPIHVDDLVAAIVALISSDATGRVPLVGPKEITLREFIASIRAGLRLGKGSFLPIPAALMERLAALGTILPGSLLDRDTLAMLERGNVADARWTRRLLGRDPRPARAFISPEEAPAACTSAKLRWLLPLLRASVAAVWLVTGVLSMGVFPVEESYGLLARTGITGWAAPVMLYGAALLDIFFGVAILLAARRRALWLAQMALIVTYTAIITWKLPEFWLHPYGPVLKNLPLLAAIWLLYELENPAAKRQADKPREKRR